MEIEVLGSGGSRGWPAPGCRCASCRRAAAGGAVRSPFRVLVDGVLELPGGAAEGYRVRLAGGGWEVTGPDGARLLAGARPEAGAGSGAGGGRYDAVLLDLIGHPAQLGWLRRQGVVDAGTLVLAGFADHRVRSERELARRCGFWGAVAAQDGDRYAVPGGVPAPRAAGRVLVLGGSGSGKSAEAELRLAAEPEVTYVATGRADPADPEWTARIAAHQARRPSWWQTRESTDLAGLLASATLASASASGAILVDSVTTWLAAAMDDCGSWDAAGTAAERAAAGRLAERTGALVAAWRQADGYVVAVSDETGLGVVPDTRAGRLFRDELGRLNQRLAAESDEFVVVVAGRAMAATD